jgi:beta-glucosidase
MNDIFSLPAFSFPKDFIWGSATSAHQIEGDDIYSANWEYEQERLKENPSYEVSGSACNSYKLYEQDVDLLCQLKHQMYRMSISWARIEPCEGQFDNQAIDHYVRHIALLKENGIKVCLTLEHGSAPSWAVYRENGMPQWNAPKGRFFDLSHLKHFERYLQVVVPRLAPYVDCWIVLNEFNGGITPLHFAKKFHAMLYHAKGYRIIKQYSSAPVSSAHAFGQYFAKRQSDPFDKALANYYDAFCNEFFFHAIRTGELIAPNFDGFIDKDVKDSVDFWAVNLYDRKMRDARKANGCGERYVATYTPMLKKSFYLDEFYPETMVHNLTRLMDKPVLITENGCATDNDEWRIAYIAEFLCALHEAMKMGVDVKGYLYWSLLDNYEWSSFTPRFGLVDVDRANGFKRTIKPSGYFLKEIIENNGFKPEILKKYLNSAPQISVKSKNKGLDFVL